MDYFLFFAVSNYQKKYFQKILDYTALNGQVFSLNTTPWPKFSAINSVNNKIEWSRLIKEKCCERRVKNKYSGFIYRILLRFEILWVALKLQALIDKEKPTTFVMWNGAHRYYQLILMLIPVKCKTFFFENGLLPNTTTLDPKGVNYHNSMPRVPEFYQHYAKILPADSCLSAKLVSRKTKKVQIASIKLPDNFIFMPFQDDKDTQIRLFSPWITDMHDFFMLGELIAKNTQFHVVFKEHPSSRIVYSELHQRTNAKILFANGNNTQELIERSQFVVTINSTVGIESLLLNKAVITLGQAFFNIKGLVQHADSLPELLRLIALFPSWSLDATVRYAFLHYLQYRYCISGRWQDASDEHFKAVFDRLIDNNEMLND